VPQAVDAVFPHRAGDDGKPQQGFRGTGGVVDPQLAAQPPSLAESCHEAEVAPVLARFAGLKDAWSTSRRSSSTSSPSRHLRRDRSTPSAALAVRTTATLLIAMTESWRTRCVRRAALS